MKFDFEYTDKLVKSMGDLPIVLTTRSGDHAETSITLNDLIEYIHVTGGCVSRHLTEADKRGER